MNLNQLISGNNDQESKKSEIIPRADVIMPNISSCYTKGTQDKTKKSYTRGTNQLLKRKK